MMINVKVNKPIKKQKLLINMSTIHCLVWTAKAVNLTNQEWEPPSFSKVIWGWYTEWTDTSSIHLMAKYKAYEQLKKSYSLNFIHNNQQTQNRIKGGKKSKKKTEFTHCPH